MTDEDVEAYDTGNDADVEWIKSSGRRVILCAYYESLVVKLVGLVTIKIILIVNFFKIND